jgi:serine/threonine protein kinase/ABC-type branched-subunit amino acid transport system substrate-binding protein
MEVDLCMGCFNKLEIGSICPYCGFNESAESGNLLYLAPRSFLAGKYLIGRVLGQGGFGITYLGWDINLEVKLAIKEFFPQGLVSRYPGQSEVVSYASKAGENFAFGIERFLNEAKMLAKFEHHPNIVSVRDFFKANNTAYMIMSYVEGKTLESYLSEQGDILPVETALSIIMPVMDALREVHEVGIMHRDISPDNILIDQRGRIMVIDFGAAREEIRGKSKSLSVILKTGYAPEEQYRSRGVQGPWTDVYAVAATYYRMITGTTPPESMDRLAEDIMVKPSLYGIEITAAQEQILLKALAVRAADRYRSMEEFQNDLMNLQKDKQIRGKAKAMIVGSSSQPDSQPAGSPHKSEVFREKVSPIISNNISDSGKIAAVSGEKPLRLSKTHLAIAAALVVVVSLALFSAYGGRTDNGVGTGDTNDQSSGAPAVSGSVLPADSPTGTVTIVGLFPLTGVLSTFGENSAEVAKLAAADVNEWLEAEGRDWRLRLEIEDTATEGPVALSKMQHWFGEGVQFFAGPQASGEAQECLAFANANQILYISPSSTSPGLAIADDWLFRFCTNDIIQGPAIGAVIKASGAEHVIFGWRGDTWGDGLQGAAEASARELGIAIDSNRLRYDPLKEVFASEAALLADYVSQAVASGVSLNKIGFNIIGFEEVVPFMVEASKYPQLKQIRWIGSDGTAFSEALLRTPAAAQFANDVKFINTMHKTEDSTANYARVRGHILQLLGRETDPYSYYTYDIIWCLAIAIDRVGYDSAAVKEILPEITQEWSTIYSASGYIELNEYGDRAFADYDYVMLNNNREWFSPGYFDGLNQQIVWQIKVF